MKPFRMLTWDAGELSSALKIDLSSVREYFTDGRRVAFIIERRLKTELGFRLAPSEGAAFDLVDGQGDKWEARNLTSSGVYFCPSYMVGSGRSFDEPGFLRKLKQLKGYILTDIEEFPNVPCWMIPKEAVERWYGTGRLGAGTKISREKALNLIEALA
ncbi:MAG: hypothetical protein ABSG59_19645 [Verrucomicrobiota bacterium]